VRARLPAVALTAAAILALAQAQTGTQARLASVRRIYVEAFAPDAASQQAQNMLVSALVASKRFVVTEIRDKADAVLKGSAIVRTSQEVHAVGEGTSAGKVAGAAAANGDHAAAAIAGMGMGASDSSLDTETVEHASVSVRLVSPDGDVVWSATKESGGGKYEGAAAAAVDACIKQLLRDAPPAEVKKAAGSQ